MAASAMPGSGGISRDWLAPFWVDIGLTLSVHRRGPRDPTFRSDASGALWRTSLTPAGPGTIRLCVRGPQTDWPGCALSPGSAPLPGDSVAVRADPACGRAHPRTAIRAHAWGPGADWLLAQVPDLLGARDSPGDFVPQHPRLRELVRLLPGLRIGRTDRVLEALVPAVLEQKVVGQEARRAWRRLLAWHGSPAPGPAPAGMRVVPSPGTWRAIPSWDWHRAGVEPVRARTIAAAARVAGRIEAASGLPGDEADRLLQSLPGIGPWTSAEIRQRASGDPDAVSVGDYHIPALVGWALAGRPADDAGMLGLLAPYRGHRYRAARLIEIGGQRPRRGPRLSARDYSAI